MNTVTQIHDRYTHTRLIGDESFSRPPAFSASTSPTGPSRHNRRTVDAFDALVAMVEDGRSPPLSSAARAPSGARLASETSPNSEEKRRAARVQRFQNPGGFSAPGDEPAAPPASAEKRGGDASPVRAFEPESGCAADAARSLGASGTAANRQGVAHASLAPQQAPQQAPAVASAPGGHPVPSDDGTTRSHAAVVEPPPLPGVGRRLRAPRFPGRTTTRFRPVAVGEAEEAVDEVAVDEVEAAAVADAADEEEAVAVVVAVAVAVDEEEAVVVVVAVAVAVALSTRRKPL